MKPILTDIHYEGRCGGMKITFYQWLNSYEFMTKREFKELPKYKQKNYRTQYKLFLMQEKGGEG